MRNILSILCLPLLVGCIDAFDSSWYNPTPLEEYSLWNNEIPDEFIEFVTLEGVAVEGDEEAPSLAGAWTHQCLPDDTCAEPDWPEFNSARQSKTILYLHGNSHHLDHYWDRIQILWRMGYRVFAIDYRGYGLSTGTPTEAGVYADGKVARDHVIERLIEEDPTLAMPDGSAPPSLLLDLAFYGFSLGSTVAIDLAVSDPPKALVTEAALGSAQAFMDDALGLGFHASVLMDARFDNVGKISSIVSPKMITHGMEDAFVAFEFSTVLYDAAEDPKTLYPVEEAEHGNVPCPTTRDASLSTEIEPCIAESEWLERVGDFIDENLP
jgi:fermentation-respiration switch protein FrsA (DUF1100 family)